MIAWAYWVGSQLPWIRRKSLESYLHWHPGDQLVLLSDRDQDVPAGVVVWRVSVDESLPYAINSDLERAAMLHRAGGVYFDTDTIWLRPLDTQVLQWKSAAWTREGPVVSVGVVAAMPGSPIMLRWLEVMRRMLKDNAPHSRTNLASAAATVTIDEFKLHAGDFPAWTLYPFRGRQQTMAKCWDATAKLPAGLTALHWYGGHPASSGANQLGPGDLDRPGPVFEALRASGVCGMAPAGGVA